MAIRIDADADQIFRSTGLPAFGSFTVMWWLYRVIDQAVDEILYYRGTNSGLSGDYIGCFVWGSNQQLALECNLGSVVNTSGTTVLPLATWVHIGMVFNGSTKTWTPHVNGVAGTAITGGTSTPTWGYEVMGSLTSNRCDARFAAFKSWEGTLTASEIQQEMWWSIPVRTTNLHRWTPLLAHTQLTDLNGGVAWTAGGTLTTEDGPPIAWSWTPSLIEIPAVVAGRTTRNTRSMGLGMQYGLGMGLPAGGRAPL